MEVTVTFRIFKSTVHSSTEQNIDLTRFKNLFLVLGKRNFGILNFHNSESVLYLETFAEFETVETISEK